MKISIKGLKRRIAVLKGRVVSDERYIKQLVAELKTCSDLREIAIAEQMKSEGRIVQLNQIIAQQWEFHQQTCGSLNMLIKKLSEKNARKKQ